VDYQIGGIDTVTDSLKVFNEKRSDLYYKDPEKENFLSEMNILLQEREVSLYRDYDIQYPFIFVFGAPRSGTTLLSQLVAYCLDVGYINNLMARFWLAPIHGIRLSKELFKGERPSTFHSDYAHTKDITDIHEFGYFWRHWLKKETMDSIVNAGDYEHKIDWSGLSKVLANIQREFDRPLVFKNIYGSYHTEKLMRTLHRVIFLYIERDPLDTAVSILEARKKYYSDLNTWWSYAPVEYNAIKDLDYRRQIAGQVFYLRRYYNNVMHTLGSDVVLKISYADLCKNPRAVLDTVRESCLKLYQIDITVINEPPRHFHFRSYNNRIKEKAHFEGLIKLFETGG